MPDKQKYEELNERQFAVVTRVTPVREGGRIMVHTYGPYSRNEAQNASNRIKRQAIRERMEGRIEVSLCTLLVDLPVTIP